MIGALDEVHNGRGGDGLAGAAEAHHAGGDHHGNAEDFDAAAGDRLLIESDVPDFYFEAIRDFRVLGPGGGELEWWFSFRTGEFEIPTDGLHTLPFGPGTTDETASFTAVIKRRQAAGTPSSGPKSTCTS